MLVIGCPCVAESFSIAKVSIARRQQEVEAGAEEAIEDPELETDLEAEAQAEEDAKRAGCMKGYAEVMTCPNEEPGMPKCCKAKCEAMGVQHVQLNEMGQSLSCYYEECFGQGYKGRHFRSSGRKGVFSQTTGYYPSGRTPCCIEPTQVYTQENPNPDMYDLASEKGFAWSTARGCNEGDVSY